MSITPSEHSNPETVSLSASDEIGSRLLSIRRRIANSCVRVGRNPDDVKLIAVTKTVPAEKIRESIDVGLDCFAENRVQEALTKIPRVCEPGFQPKIEWHFSGHLQSNKAPRAVELFDVIHSIDSFKLAERVNRAARELQRSIPVLIQVNLGGEITKSGVTTTEVPALLKQLIELESLDLKGLMSVPPYFERAQEVRPYFRRLSDLGKAAREIAGPGFTELSMGMSHDFEIAVEEGSTMVRIGTDLFGPRPLQ